ncbi:MAG: primosomal protein N' [Bacteroidales bacterium]|jgi:primosomal protein N' (replication factor Y)|nr:primosomal protein N' [Bacteroidales bacterium]
MERITLFADLILPLPLPGFYTYRVPFEMNNQLHRGQRVVVQFGKKKIYTALVYRIHQNVPKNFQPKYILSILDEKPIVNEKQFSFWEWMVNYYMCRPGEVMNAALPSSLKLASESRLVLNPDFNKNYELLSEKEYLVAEALEIQKKLSLQEISKIVEQQKIIPLVKTLIEKKVALLEEEIQIKYKPKKEVCVRLKEEYSNETELQKTLDKLSSKAYKQMELLLTFLQMNRFTDAPQKHISRPKLLEKAGASAIQLQALITKGILETYEIIQTRLKDFEHSISVDSIILSEDQIQCLNDIKESFKNKNVVLLHGITSSGKTELYIKLIQETIDAGQQVLFLLPEIALTTQVINRVRKYFGKQVGVYHSKYSNDERVEVWYKILNTSNDSITEPYKIVLGARSALFLPYSKLGLVIVDEEHDSSYKQTDPPPHYNARDAAIYLAQLYGAKVLLGSATPALETYHNTITSKYGLAELHKRYGDIELPEITIANIKEQSRQKRMKSYFSIELFDLIKQALKNKEQVILFQNRRGYSTRIECNDCNWIPQCKYCDVTLIYHKHANLLKCHYCGYSTNVPHECPACKSTNIHTKGFGTERIEEETAMVFPGVNIARMDLDSTRNKYAYHQILNDFEDRKTQILIGTQMVTKGLDFDNVSVVGILNADQMLSYPDFRAHERSFQLMAQVSGRAGRRSKRGKVVIQTFTPDHPMIQLALQHNYTAMFNQQLIQRRQFNYPPFTRLIQLTLKHKDTDILNAAAAYLTHNLRLLFHKKVIGPEYPMVSKIRNLYLKNILLKLDKDGQVQKHKERVMQMILEMNKKFSSVIVSIDVDPL